jgi:hypothetical protein
VKLQNGHNNIISDRQNLRTSWWLCSHERKEFRNFKNIKHVSYITIVNTKRGRFLISPLRANFDPRLKLAPMGELSPQGVKLSPRGENPRPSILRGDKAHPRGLYKFSPRCKLHLRGKLLLLKTGLSLPILLTTIQSPLVSNHVRKNDSFWKY